MAFAFTPYLVHVLFQTHPHSSVAMVKQAPAYVNREANKSSFVCTSQVLHSVTLSHIHQVNERVRLLRLTLQQGPIKACIIHLTFSSSFSARREG
jgi:hypothetical protein